MKLFFMVKVVTGNMRTTKIERKKDSFIIKMDAKKGKNQTTLVDSSGKVNAPEFAKASKPYKGKTSYK